METLHHFSLVLGALISYVWMILVTMALGDKDGGGPLGLLVKKWNWLKYPIGILGLLFFVRIWWVAIEDVQDLINGFFSIFGCSPVDIIKTHSL